MEDIAIWHAQKAGVCEIARRLGRSPSTISRELRRNASTRTWRLDYRASTAQWHAERRARRPKVPKLAAHERLREYVQERLAGVIRGPDGKPVPGPVTATFSGRRHGRRQDRRWATAWSPEQIARRLPADFPDDETMRVSHEAIYRALYIQGRGALKRELIACLRTGRALRVPRARARQRRDGMVTPEVMISARPAQAEDRAVPGHWEGDRQGDGPARSAGDRHRHPDLHSPWQRGTNENTNGLLRQYFPNGTDLTRWTSDKLDAVAAASTTGPAKHAEFARFCQARGIRTSVGRTGICYDNAAAESFFSAQKNEMYYRQSFPGRARARFAVADYIEVFHNRKRLHSTLGYRTPAEALTDYQAAATAA